jgi:hypothetical protein
VSEGVKSKLLVCECKVSERVRVSEGVSEGVRVCTEGVRVCTEGVRVCTEGVRVSE